MLRSLVIALLLLILTTINSFSDSVTLIESNSLSIDTMWTLIAAFLVFIIQAGFAMLETGFTRAKNATNIMMRNLMGFSIGSLAFFAIGFGLMFGADIGGLFVTDLFFLAGVRTEEGGLSNFAFWIFQVAFAATAATIVSGSLAERTQFKAYLVYSIFITAFIYPIVGHWGWGGGWLSEMDFIDFAGINNCSFG